MNRETALALLLAASFSPAYAETPVDPSARISIWSGDRRASQDATQANAELWLRTKTALGADATLKFEGWIAANATGASHADADIREGFVQIAAGQVRARVGRQLMVWGRADRINPTDVASARDFRRLTEDDEDNRLGLAAVSIETDIAGGALSVHWLPEFRASKLPQTLEPAGLAVVAEAPKQPYGQVALRFERFGEATDWSVTAAQVADRLPWLSLQRTTVGPQLALQYPMLRMIGADMATVVGIYGLRVEAAGYIYKSVDIAPLATKAPAFSLVVGLDRSFPGQWSVILQTALRVSRTLTPIHGRSSEISARNDVIHGVWSGAIGGGFLRIRKVFSGDRGSVELVGAGFTRGGSYVQVKASYALRDGLKLVAMAEHYDGAANSFFGRQRENKLVMLGLRAGF